MIGKWDGKRNKDARLLYKKQVKEFNIKKECTFNPQINSISQWLSEKSNGRLSSQLQSPRSSLLNLIRGNSPPLQLAKTQDEPQVIYSRIPQRNENVHYGSYDGTLNSPLKSLNGNNSHIEIHNSDNDNILNILKPIDESLRLQEWKEERRFTDNLIPYDKLINEKLNSDATNANYFTKERKEFNFTYDKWRENVKKINKWLFIVKK